MANVLPEQLKKQNQKEYLFRFIIITEVLLSAVLLFSIILVLPSYGVSLVEEQNKTAQIIQMKEYNSTRAKDSREEAIEMTKASLSVLGERDQDINISSVVATILGVVDETGGIVFNGIFYGGFEKDKTSQKVIISGVASNRNRLLLFTKNLENIGGFTDVVLPVSNLKEEVDIAFSVTADVNIK